MYSCNHSIIAMNILNNIHFLGLMLLMLCLFGACKTDNLCSSKQDFEEAVSDFITEYQESEIQSNGKTLTAEQQAAYEHRFRSLVNYCYKKFKPEMSLVERQDFWKKSLKYVLTRVDLDTKEGITDQLEDPFYIYCKDEVVALIKESGIGFLMSLQEVMKDDLPRLMDMFSEEIEKIGKDFLENMFKQ